MAEASEEGLGSKWAVVPMIVIVVVVVVVSYIKTGLYTAVNNTRVLLASSMYILTKVIKLCCGQRQYVRHF